MVVVQKKRSEQHVAATVGGWKMTHREFRMASIDERFHVVILLAKPMKKLEDEVAVRLLETVLYYRYMGPGPPPAWGLVRPIRGPLW
jgi:hypothetical protein